MKDCVFFLILIGEKHQDETVQIYRPYTERERLLAGESGGDQSKRKAESQVHGCIPGTRWQWLDSCGSGQIG